MLSISEKDKKGRKLEYFKKLNYDKISVTGGNGFIGSNLIIRLLKDKNNKVLNVDKKILNNKFSQNLIFKNILITTKNYNIVM